jgi:hypothetical protein
MNTEKLRKLIEDRIEQLDAERTNLPEKEQARKDMETWIDCLEWVLIKIMEK